MPGGFLKKISEDDYNVVIDDLFPHHSEKISDAIFELKYESDNPSSYRDIVDKNINAMRLFDIGSIIGIPAHIQPLDQTIGVLRNDVKEAVEALLQASFLKNGETAATEIVESLYEIAEDEDLMDEFLEQF